MAALSALTLIPDAFAQSFWIDRVAGNSGAVDDEVPALEASLNYVSAVAADRSGNLYIADTGDHRIRRVDAAGTITTVAGTGTEGFSGDGGPATNAQLAWPRGVTVDALGRLYIGDASNHRIRRVDAAGTITTVAGAGAPGFGGDGGPAPSARLYGPWGVAVDASGNLYIADRSNHRIRRVDLAGTITTVAGTGTEGFSGDGGPATNAQLAWPRGVTVDASGNLYIADRSNHRIRRVDLAGTITTVAGTGTPGLAGDGGPAPSARLNSPSGVAVNRSGSLYISDFGNHRIRRVDAVGTITTVAGAQHGSSGDCGPASAAWLSPAGIAVDPMGRIVVADALSRTVRRLSGAIPPRCSASPAPLSEWTVGSGQVVFAGLSSRSRGCLSLDAPVNGVSYIVHASEWQRRAPSASTWTTVGGTVRMGRLCVFEPTEPGQYRAVAEISVGGRARARYRSGNTITGPPSAADSQPSFGTASIADQSYVSGMAIRPLALPAASGGDSPLMYALQPSVPGLAFDTQALRLYGTPTSAGTYSMRFSARDRDGDTATLGFSITVQSSGGAGGATRYTAGARIAAFPTGVWTPDVTSGGSFLYSAGTATVTLNHSGYIEEGDRRYTCESSGGCEIVNGTVTKGVVVESSTGEPPANGGSGGTGTNVGVAGDFDLDPDNRSPRGIAFANGRFYVVDWADEEVYAYTASGGRDAAGDFELDRESVSPRGIAFANGRFYVVDWVDEKVYAHTASGGRDAAGDFDLDRENSHPEGIAFANGRFYVVDSLDEKVYAYTASGGRAAAGDFDLDRENSHPEGIAFANGRFYVVDSSDEKAYAYAASGGRAAAADFDLDRDNGSPRGIAFANGRFYVVDWSDEEVYAYTASGGRDAGDGSSSGDPDLVVTSPAVSDSSPTPGGSFTLSATVRNGGGRGASATTLRYYRSSNSTIGSSDTQVGTDAVGRLAGLATSAESIRLTAPSSAGTYYYGACVDAVANESDTANNCSSAVAVRVADSSGATEPMQYTPLSGLRVSPGRVRYSFFSAGTCIQLSNSSINGVIYTVHSSKWQRRASVGDSWQDVPGTEKSGGLCSYNPDSSGEYRMVAEITIGGRRGAYASENTITVP